MLNPYNAFQSKHVRPHGDSRFLRVDSTQNNTILSIAMPFYGQTWFLSSLSGIIAVVVYYLCMVRPTLKDGKPPPKPTMYISVFMLVAALVYGSFVVAESTGNCRFIDVQPDIQTGSAAPF